MGEKKCTINKLKWVTITLKRDRDKERIIYRKIVHVILYWDRFHGQNIINVMTMALYTCTLTSANCELVCNAYNILYIMNVYCILWMRLHKILRFNWSEYAIRTRVERKLYSNTYANAVVLLAQSYQTEFNEFVLRPAL